MDEIIVNKRITKKKSIIISLGLLLFLLLICCIAAGFYAHKTTINSNAENSRPATPLPTGQEFVSAAWVDENGDSIKTKIKSISFDYYTNQNFSSNNLYLKNGTNVIENIKPIALTQQINEYLVLNDDMYDVYILSQNKMYASEDSSNLFAYLKNLVEINFYNFFTDKVVNMSGLFANCKNLTRLDLSGFNTENVTSMENMFAECGALELNLSSFKTPKLQNTAQMFKDCRNLILVDLSNFDTKNVTNYGYMFSNDRELVTIYANENVVFKGQKQRMFENTYKLVGGLGTRYIAECNSNEYARLDKDTAHGYFVSVSTKKENVLPSGVLLNKILKGEFSSNKHRIKTLTFDYYSAPNEYLVNSKNVIAGVTAENISQDIQIYRVNIDETLCDVYVLSNKQIYAPRSLDCAFFRIDLPTEEDFYTNPFALLEEITFNNFSTEGCVSMAALFKDLSLLKKLDLSKFDTSEVVDMTEMFMLCCSLEDLNISSFNTSKVASFVQMFGRCASIITLDLTHFNTDSLQDMYGMFWEMYNLEMLDVSSFNLQDLNKHQILNPMGNLFYETHKIKTFYVNESWPSDNEFLPPFANVIVK